jgi:hypothetical protein
MQLAMMQPPLPALELTSTHFWLSFAPCAKFVNYFSLAHFTVLILVFHRLRQMSNIFGSVGGVQHVYDRNLWLQSMTRHSGAKTSPGS